MTAPTHVSTPSPSVIDGSATPWSAASWSVASWRAGSWRVRLRMVIALVRRIVGVPDYETYLAFMQRNHPECMPMDARTFERERLADKYARPGSRCC